MATTYPLATLGPTITSAGISIPSFNDVYQSLIATFQSIYGSDVVVTPDSQDGQWIAAIASAINDCNNGAVACYNAFSPATAQGANLSSVVKINGIARNVSSASTVDVTVVGQAGTTITNGIVTDGNSIQWALPSSVVIPSGGQVTVTATCQTQGAISLASGTALKISTPTLGWQSATTADNATAGSPVETDAALRQRQTTSTALPSRTVLEGTVGAVWAVPGVTRVTPYENDTSTTDANGVPGNKIYIVVEGGDSAAIANAIASKKTPGTGTYGTTSVSVQDAYGIAHNIAFYRPTYDAITCAITLKALAGYTSATGAAVQAAVAAYINSVAIGGAPSGMVEWDSALTAAKSVSGGNTFRIVSLALSGPSGAGSPDVPLAFNHAGQATSSSVTITVT
ncbi:baseplate J/gp47 family protein [Caballeronia sp. Sq4a]|uniref:baseplate J/gp47 family protein n=1 Tax=Caballeronia sp. Sq4a TaxID=2878152 RepID=UPI0020BD91B2|nr:baseplate J/gp47 family protein [Caballeronia sp. Sq4a]